MENNCRPTFKIDLDKVQKLVLEQYTPAQRRSIALSTEYIKIRSALSRYVKGDIGQALRMAGIKAKHDTTVCMLGSLLFLVGLSVGVVIRVTSTGGPYTLIQWLNIMVYLVAISSGTYFAVCRAVWLQDFVKSKKAFFKAISSLRQQHSQIKREIARNVLPPQLPY
jgi:hypothetical protein